MVVGRQLLLAPVSLQRVLSETGAQLLQQSLVVESQFLV